MVSVEKCENYNLDNVRAAVRRTFDNLGGVERFVKPGMTVALKPNLVFRRHPDAAATTHPSLVQAVAETVGEIVRSKEGGRVVIAESPGGIYNTARLNGVYSGCGMVEAVKASDAELNFDLSDVIVDNPRGKFVKKVTVIKPLADADFIINLPKLKAHGQMAFTGAVKNMFGAVPGILKGEYHFRMPDYSRFANALIDIYLSVEPGLSIMDAITAMEGHGPSAGDPRHIGALLAGEDGFEVDFAALNLIRASSLHVPIIREAVGRGLCPRSIGQISLCGCDLGEFDIRGFRMPQLDTLRTIEFYDNSIFRFLTKRIIPRPVFIHSLCTGCAECRNNCPPRIISMKDGKPHAYLDKCIRCFCCQELCPRKAVRLKRPFLVECLIRLSKKI